MLVLIFPGIEFNNILDRYKDQVIYIDENLYNNDNNYPINYLEYIKKCLQKYNIVFINYSDIYIYLDGLKIKYNIIVPSKKYIEDAKFDKYRDILKTLKINDTVVLIDEDNDLLQYLNKFINIKNKETNVLPDNINNKSDNNSITESKKLELEDIANDTKDLTDTDMREFKEIQNKLKIGMLLQAKNSLKRILKLSDMLDTLYDKAINRINDQIDDMTLNQIMVTTQYISTSLKNTNDLIMTLITNEKVQNLFVIDNPSINITSNNANDIDSRSRIRKAVEIILNNYDAIENGNFINIKNPNNIDVTSSEKIKDSEDNTNGNTTT